MSRFLINPALPSLLKTNIGLLPVLKVIADQAADEARATAPVGETGTFRDSIQSDAGLDSDGQVKGRIYSDDPSAPYIEFGTIDTPTFATLRNAAETVVGS